MGGGIRGKNKLKVQSAKLKVGKIGDKATPSFIKDEAVWAGMIK